MKQFTWSVIYKITIILKGKHNLSQKKRTPFLLTGLRAVCP